MGICSSCLSLNRDPDLSDDDEQSRLLFDDPHANHYGSFGDQNTGIIQADPQEIQRETEALQKVVAQTSNHLVDIFSMPTQNIPATSATVFPAQDARLLRYQDLLAKMSSQRPSTTNQLLAESTTHIADGWVSEEDDAEESKGLRSAKSKAIGPLLGGFGDADSVD